MGLVRFMTVYDDEEERVLNLNQRMMFDISSPATFYRSEGKSYLDNFNANSRKFINMRKSGAELTVPTIPSAVFQYSLEKLRDTGYLAVFVVCPHGKGCLITKKPFMRLKTSTEQQNAIQMFL